MMRETVLPVFRGGHRPPMQREITTRPLESRRAPVGGAHL
jgi:hypothetical protein